jgi:hypothetical protein
MNLFIYINGTLRGLSDNTNAEFTQEFITIPGGFEAGTYGMGYVYKSGTSNNLKFNVEIANFGGTLTDAGGESGVIYQSSGTYTLANINAYNPEAPHSEIEQSMIKSGLNYTGLTTISIPGSSSRVTAKKESTSARLRKFLSAKSRVITLE